MTDLIVANELRDARQVMDAAKRRSDRDQLGGRPPDDEPGEVKTSETTNRRMTPATWRSLGEISS